MATATVVKGLEGVVAAHSGICWIDGYAGVLAYRGIDIHELAEKSTFEETAYLLWHGHLPGRAQLNDFSQKLTDARRVPQQIYDLLRSLPKSATPMEALRTAVSALSMFDPDEAAVDHDSNVRKAFALTAQLPMLVAAFDRIRKGQEIIEPDPSLRHAANFLWMLHGKKPIPAAERTFDIALILHADHELNASTFAARVTAATLSDIYSAVVSAIGTLKGPLHGGANAEVMKMLLELGQTASGDRIDEFIRGRLARKEKISGFGHRVYRTEDPRATHLRQMSRDLGKRSGSTAWFDMSQRIEALVKAEKKLNPNVDFYSASMYYTLGIPIDLYTPIFAVSRISGWTAHILEQYANNRLIRPRADYTGPVYPQRFVPLEQR